MATRTLTVTWTEDPADPIVDLSNTASDEGVPNTAAGAGPAGSADSGGTTLYKWTANGPAAFAAGVDTVVAQMTDAFPAAVPLVGEYNINIRPDDRSQATGGNCELDAQLADLSWAVLMGIPFTLQQGGVVRGPIELRFPPGATGRLRLRFTSPTAITRAYYSVLIEGTPRVVVELK